MMDAKTVEYISNILKRNLQGIPVREMRLDPKAQVEDSCNVWMADKAIIVTDYFNLEITNPNEYEDEEPEYLTIRLIRQFDKAETPWILNITDELPVTLCKIEPATEPNDYCDEIYFTYEKCEFDIYTTVWSNRIYMSMQGPYPVDNLSKVLIDPLEDYYTWDFRYDESIEK